MPTPFERAWRIVKGEDDETAWALLKMPITSPITDEKVWGDKHIRQRADFTDPKTGEVIDLYGYDFLPIGDDEIQIDMKRRLSPNEQRSGRNSGLVGRIYDTPENEYRQTGVDEKWRRRGIGTAMMEMLAHLYAKRGMKVKPTKLTPDGGKLWGDKTEWRVRDDL